MKRWRRDPAEGLVAVSPATVAWAREALAEHVHRLVAEPGRFEDRDEWMQTYNKLASTANDLGTTLDAIVARLAWSLPDGAEDAFAEIRRGGWPARRA